MCFADMISDQYTVLYEANEDFAEDDRWSLNDIRDLLNLVMHAHFADMISDQYTISEDANKSFVNII